VSVNGAEEDGVDNRVEAPTWVPDGGSDSNGPGEESDKAAVPAPEIPADSGADKLPAAQDTSAGTRPKVSKGATAGDGSPADATDGKPAAGSARSGFGSASGLGSPSGYGGPQSGNGATQPAPVLTSAAAQGLAQPPSSALPGAAAAGAAGAAAGAAGAARGLAARVSANLSGLSKPKEKPKAKAPVTRKPAAQGMPPKRPPVPAADRGQPGLSYSPVAGPQARRAQLRLDRIEPWSVMKFSFLISIVGWVILLVAVSVLYFTLSKLGVFTSIEHTVGLVTTSKSNPGSNAASWFKASRVLGYTMLVGAVNVILMTALATIGAVLYNLVTMLAGGIEVTLKESD
jgi:hypothetical protein